MTCTHLCANVYIGIQVSSVPVGTCGDMMVLISQALCYLSHPDLDDGDMELLKQELASELVS